MSATEDRFVTAPLDPTGALVTAVGYETVGAAPRDHRGLPSPFLTFIDFIARDPEGNLWSFGTYAGAPRPA